MLNIAQRGLITSHIIADITVLLSLNLPPNRVSLITVASIMRD